MTTRGEHKGLAALVCVALIALAVFVPTSAAHADDPVQQLAATPLPGVMDAMVVDAATGHIFVSLPGASSVAVLDNDGTLVQTIAGEAGARGLALIGDHLYVVAANAGAIDEIDTTTLTRTRTVSSGLAAMTDIVYASGALWVTTIDGPARTTLVRVSIADGATTSFTNVLFPDATGLVGDPADTTQLISYTPGYSPVVIARIDLSTQPPTKVVESYVTSPVDISNVNDIAVSPDGTRLVPSGGAPYQFDELRTSDLAANGVVYPANPYPTAVEIGDGLLVGGMNARYRRDIVLYALGDPSALLGSYDFGSTTQTVENAGLALSPDGSRLFVVTGDNGFWAPTDTFRVLTVPAHAHVSPPPTTTTTSTTSTTSTTTPIPSDSAQTVALGVSPSTTSFGRQRVGTYGRGVTITVTNTGSAPLSLENMTFGGPHKADFFGATNCFPSRRPRVLVVHASCRAVLYFAPLKLGARSATLIVSDDSTSSPHKVTLSGTGTEGYFIGGAHGQVAAFGDAVFHGDATNVALNSPIVSLRTTPNGAGYWLLGRDGGIFSFGNAHFYGSTGNMTLRQPVLGMAPTHAGAGYWLVASDGGIFAFGDAKFYGSTGNLTLQKPIVGMAATPSGHGYWLVASDGGIFAFGDAHFYGSPPATSAHVVGIAPTPSGHGYWTVTNTGQVARFGDAPFYGDVRFAGTTEPIGMAPTAPPLSPRRLGYASAAVSSSDGSSLGERSAAIAGFER
ncbi:MAG: hypothetical protein QOI55_3142 [Actinomycetota bacterium]|nr:hypothetical protein [Actinomycetota bacterium]